MACSVKSAPVVSSFCHVFCVGSDGEVEQRACRVIGLELPKGGELQTYAGLFRVCDVLLFLCFLPESCCSMRLVLDAWCGRAA
jgi:hypothetical protein